MSQIDPARTTPVWIDESRPSKTVKRPDNAARVVITLEVEVSPTMMAEASNHRRYAPYIVADLLGQSDPATVMQRIKDAEGITVLGYHVEVAH